MRNAEGDLGPDFQRGAPCHFTVELRYRMQLPLPHCLIAWHHTCGYPRPPVPPSRATFAAEDRFFQYPLWFCVEGHSGSFSHSNRLPADRCLRQVGLRRPSLALLRSTLSATAATLGLGGVWRVSGLGVISGPLRFMSGRHEGLRFFRMALTHHTRGDDFLIHKYEYKIPTHRLSKYKLTKASKTTVVWLVCGCFTLNYPASRLCLFLLLTSDDRHGSIVVSKKALFWKWTNTNRLSLMRAQGHHLG